MHAGTGEKAECHGVITIKTFSSRAVHSIATRIPRTRQRAAWAFLIAATLVFKSFVPLLAVASAQMQGKAVADICSIYGVRLAPAAGGHVHDGAAHAMGHAGHMAGMEMPASGGATSPHDPDDHVAHAQDHCALTGLAACAVFAATLWVLADWLAGDGGRAAFLDSAGPPRDASARWLILRLHAPPRLV